MEIVKYLFTEFFTNNFSETLLLISLSLVSNILHTNIITYFNSAVITYVQERAIDKVVIFFKYFIYSRIFLAIFNYLYKLTQDHIMTRLKQWFRFALIDVIFKTNNENISNINFTKLATPIHHLSETCYYVVSDTMSYTIPYTMFFLASVFYFSYQNITLGIIFFLGNLLWIILIFYIIPVMRKRSVNYESSNLFIEKHVTESLNNIDKILTRGQSENEINIFSKESDSTVEAHRDYYTSIAVTKFSIELITLLTMFICIGYSIHLFIEEKLSSIQFVALFTLLMVFKERMNSVANLSSDIVEQYGKLEAVMEPFNHFDARVLNINKNYSKIDLDFNHIELKNVSFKYGEDFDYVMQDKNLTIDTSSHKIIGITGESGKGKSTITKLLLKMYVPEKGSILIDNVDIQSIEPDYLRDNITYINQNTRLFDKTVLENVLYGCLDEKHCREEYKKILSYPKINNLYKNVDLNNDLAGYSGEKLSGGQRQVVNIISGLVNPSKILILDEPTNALDQELKVELLEVIKEFKSNKQAILIISHDSDVFKIFDENIEV